MRRNENTHIHIHIAAILVVSISRRHIDRHWLAHERLRLDNEWWTGERAFTEKMQFRKIETSKKNNNKNGKQKSKQL